MRVWLYCFIVYIKILSYSRQSLLTKQQIRLEVTIISQQVYMAWKYLNILKREAEVRQDFVLFSSLRSDSISSNLLYTAI